MVHDCDCKCFRPFHDTDISKTETPLSFEDAHVNVVAGDDLDVVAIAVHNGF